MEILEHYKHINLTNDQNHAVKNINDFLNGKDKVFLLQGYAGSGKTTLLKGVVEYLNSQKKKFQLMAPTGRAAKVINEKTGFEATTIHKGIYNFDELEEIEKSEEKNDYSFLYQFKLTSNNEASTIYIVDEASMLSDNLSEGEFFRFGSGFLLKDLMQYGKILDPELNSKIIFVGDPAQLAPVGMNFSPALDEEYLKDNYGVSAVSCQMTEVKRQSADNGILNSASKIRKCLTSGYLNDFDIRGNNIDIFNPLFQNYLSIYKAEKGRKIIICFKNKTAHYINKTIRKDKYGTDLSIQPTDIIIIGKNNYQLNILNGEFAVVSEVDEKTESREIRFNKKGGGVKSVLLTWRKISFVIPDEKGQSRVVNALMLENFLQGDTYLLPEEQRALYIDFKQRHPKLYPNTESFKEAISNDPYFNCVQIKYGYAVTCHKAQGGEWDNAFVFWDKGVQPNFNFLESAHNKSGKTNPDFYRWAYTAITRGSKKLYCVNPPYFNSFSGMKYVSNEVLKAQNELMGKETNEEELNFNNFLQELNKFRLESSPISIQDHFISRYNTLKKHGITIKSWQRVSYEIRYIFEKDGETAGFKYWVNGKDVFKINYATLPSLTSSEILFESISKVLQDSSDTLVIRNPDKKVINKIQFDSTVEEEKPFLKNLFDKIGANLENDCNISNIEHLEYRERYTFEVVSDSIKIDFEYNKDGFFGRVLPVGNNSNSGILKEKTIDLVNNLKE